MKRFLAACGTAVLLLAGCTHTTPFTDDHYFRALGEKNEVVFTVDVEGAREILDAADGEGTLGGLDPILERSGRISVAMDPSAADGIPVFYGGIEGNFGKVVTDTALSFSGDFDKAESGEVPFYRSSSAGLDVKVPQSGLVLFSNDDIEKVYRKTYRERELFIPYDVSQRMAESLFGIYMEKPHDIGFLTDQIPEAMLLSMNSIWLVLNGVKDDYRVSGVLLLSTEQASRVLGTTLRLNYLKTIRKLEVPIEGWKEHIDEDGKTITLAGMYISNEEVYDLLSTVLDSI